MPTWGDGPSSRRCGGGADVVICPRITDASLVVGPAAWHHGWSPTDWDRLAGAVVAGHVIECGPQTTGGNYAFFTEVAGVEHPGFPIAEVAADGSSVITKHPGSGGEVSVGTVTAQLLYEIAGPHYPNTDVVARFDTVTVDQEGPDRVRVSGVRGFPAPDHRQGLPQPAGWVAQLDDLRADRARHRGEGRPHPPLPRGSPGRCGTVRRVRCPPHPLGQTRRPPQRRGHRPVAHHGEGRRPRAGGPALLRRGHRAGPGRLPRAPPHRSARLGHGLRRVLARAGAGRAGGPRGGPRRRAAGGGAPHRVPDRGRAGDHDQIVDSSPDLALAPDAAGPPTPCPAPTADRRPPTGTGSPVACRSGTVIGARSGDKGGNANVGLWARSDEAWSWLDGYLTFDEFRALLPEADELEVRRYAFPNLRALNFVVVGLLGEGVASSTRPDPQAKGLGEYLRSRLVDIPVALLPVG